MSEGEVEPEGDDEEYYVIPEEAIHLLPEEWQKQLRAMADNGRAILASVDNELTQLSRLSTSFVNVVQLKYVQQRLADFKFAVDMSVILELDMLTTAFVVTYARLHEGKGGSGFARDKLPKHLREIHDNIIEIRNKRFAHNAGHHTASNALEIGFYEGQFLVNMQYSLGFHVGGAVEWRELVEFIDAMMVDRVQSLLARLAAKTGYDWVQQKGVPPKEGHHNLIMPLGSP